MTVRGALSVETRRAEWARRSWSAQLRRCSDSVAAPSQQRCAHHERSTGHCHTITPYHDDHIKVSPHFTSRQLKKRKSWVTAPC